MGLARRPVLRVQGLTLLVGLGLVGLVVWEMRSKSPIIDFRVLGERNFAVSCIIMFCAFAGLYAASVALPGMLQSLFGYDALRSGLVMSPSGVSSLAAMVLVGFLMLRGVDARWLIAIGLVVMAAGNYWMARLNLEVGPWQVVGPRMLLTLGLGLMFAPCSMAAYKYVPAHLRGAAVGLLSLLRTEGGSVGTSMASTIEHRREQFHLARLAENVNPLNPQVREFLGRSHDFFLHAHRRPSEGAATVPPELGRAAPTTGRFACIFRCLLAVRRLGGGTRSPRPADETLRRRKGRTHRRGVTVWIQP